LENLKKIERKAGLESVFLFFFEDQPVDLWIDINPEGSRILNPLT